MGGCFGNHWVDRAMEQQLMNHLNNEEMEDVSLDQDAEDYSKAKQKSMDYLAKIHGKGPVRNDVWESLCYYSKHFNIIVWRDGRADIVRNSYDVLLETALIDINSPHLGVDAVKDHAYQNYEWY